MNKSLAQLAQEVLVLRITGCRVTKTLYLWPYKVRKVLVNEEGIREERIFVTQFCGSI
jgi:hypothetical protein